MYGYRIQVHFFLRNTTMYLKTGRYQMYRIRQSVLTILYVQSLVWYLVSSLEVSVGWDPLVVDENAMY